MLPTSGTFNFQSIEIELIIREAFERVGITGEFIEPQKLDSAKRSIDLILLEWMNKGINLWTLEVGYLPLIPFQSKYTLPVSVSDIIQANLRTSSRQLNGTAASSNGGVANNAFDNNSATACTQDANNGNISYDYGDGVTQQINFIGIQSNSNTLYSIAVEVSEDNAAWTALLTLPPQNFTAGVNVWFEIPVPVKARAYRIRETGGATLDIQEIYFNNNIFDLPVANVSRYEYLTYPNKQLSGRPCTYYLDRRIVPVLNLWPAPSDTYNCLQYSYKKMMEDTGKFYSNTIQIPARFYPSLIWGLSWHLAIKFQSQMTPELQAEYEKSFNLATAEDSEGASIRIHPDYTSSGVL